MSVCVCVCVSVVAFKQTSFTSERPGANWRIEHGPELDAGVGNGVGVGIVDGLGVGLGVGLGLGHGRWNPGWQYTAQGKAKNVT